jgi:hypothetical protein
MGLDVLLLHSGDRSSFLAVGEQMGSMPAHFGRVAARPDPIFVARVTLGRVDGNYRDAESRGLEPGDAGQRTDIDADIEVHKRQGEGRIGQETRQVQPIRDTQTFSLLDNILPHGPFPGHEEMDIGPEGLKKLGKGGHHRQGLPVSNDAPNRSDEELAIGRYHRCCPVFSYLSLSWPARVIGNPVRYQGHWEVGMAFREVCPIGVLRHEREAVPA